VQGSLEPRRWPAMSEEGYPKRAGLVLRPSGCPRGPGGLAGFGAVFDPASSHSSCKLSQWQSAHI